MQHVSLSLPPQKRKSAGGLPKKFPHYGHPLFLLPARFCFRRSSISSTQACWCPFTLLPVARVGSAQREEPPRSHQKQIIPFTSPNSQRGEREHSLFRDSRSSGQGGTKTASIHLSQITAHNHFSTAFKSQLAVAQGRDAGRDKARHRNPTPQPQQ